MKLSHVMMVAFLFIAGCADEASRYSITTGSNASDYSSSTKYKYVVWGSHPMLSAAVRTELQEKGSTVVERARLEQVFSEQRIRLMHTSEDNSKILRVGKLVGADHVVFIEHSTTDARTTSSDGALSFIKVAVRAVNVESGEILWSATATFPEPIHNLQSAMPYLAQTATKRATCPIREGYEWIEDRPGKSGCLKK